MHIYFQNRKISLKEIETMKSAALSVEEKKTFELIRDWRLGKQEFDFFTSGSTSEKSKKISLNRKTIEYSVQATFNYIDPTAKIKNTLLCLNPHFIGGAMVVFRSLVKNIDLWIVPPSNNPINQLPKHQTIDLVSLVPLQLQSMGIKEINRFTNILVGSAPLQQESSCKAHIYETFGMTETTSHFALRKLPKKHFETIGDAQVQLSEQHTLNVKGSITQHHWLKTNDLIKVISPTQFIWKGRKDFVINSGGIKIIPEMIENKIKVFLNAPYVISSISDKLLGEKIVLVVEGNQKPIVDPKSLSKYEMPKLYLQVIELPKTISGKVKRHAVKKLLRECPITTLKPLD